MVSWKKHSCEATFETISIYLFESISIHKVMSVSKTCSNVMTFLQDTNSQVMFLCKTLWFCKIRLLKPVMRHVWPEDLSLCLRLCLHWVYFLLFLLLKTRQLPRHVLYMTPRHHFYSDQPNKTIT